MRFGVIGEDICDVNSLKFIIQKLCPSAQVCTMPCRGSVISDKLSTRILNLQKRYEDISAIIILSDLDRKNCAKIVQDIKKKISQSLQPEIIIQIAVQNIEAWYFAMPEAVEKAFPKLRPFKRPTQLTDNVRHPKSQLNSLFYSKLKRSFHETSDGPKIAKNFIYEPELQYNNHSFMRFIKKIQNIT
ncbi:DUF4276 family protein [bacterium]|nr:DUF4276 family protein [FCB group bacterium]MBL7192298.1 DUF4276 family protein [bacterium]